MTLKDSCLHSLCGDLGMLLPNGPTQCNSALVLLCKYWNVNWLLHSIFLVYCCPSIVILLSVLLCVSHLKSKHCTACVHLCMFVCNCMRWHKLRTFVRTFVVVILGPEHVGWCNLWSCRWCLHCLKIYLAARHHLWLHFTTFWGIQLLHCL